MLKIPVRQRRHLLQVHLMATSTTGTSPAPRARRRRPTGEVVLGVDTHRDAHVAAVLSLVGAMIDTEVFPATAVGRRDLLPARSST